MGLLEELRVVDNPDRDFITGDQIGSEMVDVPLARTASPHMHRNALRLRPADKVRNERDGSDVITHKTVFPVDTNLKHCHQLCALALPL
jgi:hypothetical protein